MFFLNISLTQNTVFYNFIMSSTTAPPSWIFAVVRNWNQLIGDNSATFERIRNKFDSGARTIPSFRLIPLKWNDISLRAQGTQHNSINMGGRVV